MMLRFVDLFKVEFDRFGEVAEGFADRPALASHVHFETLRHVPVVLLVHSGGEVPRRTHASSVASPATRRVPGRRLSLRFRASPARTTTATRVVAGASRHPLVRHDDMSRPRVRVRPRPTRNADTIATSTAATTTCTRKVIQKLSV